MCAVAQSLSANAHVLVTPTSSGAPDTFCTTVAGAPLSELPLANGCTAGSTPFVYSSCHEFSRPFSCVTLTSKLKPPAAAHGTTPQSLIAAGMLRLTTGA